MEEKLGAILSNPQMMQQIMSMAQAMSPPPEPQGRPEQPPEPAPPALPDFSVMQKLAGMTRQSGIDKNQQALLRALSPYISRERSQKPGKSHARGKNGTACLGVSQCRGAGYADREVTRNVQPLF